MKVIFMGTPDFAVPSLEKLIESKHEVVLVVTQPDKPRGRGNQVSFSPVKEVAVKAGIPVFQPDRIKTAESVAYLKEFDADVIVVVAFGQILSKEILDMPRYGCVNVHGSLLPKYRGAAPIQWAVLNGDKVSGVTTMRMDEGLDTGDIMMKEEYVLAEDETAGSLFDRLMECGARLLLETLQALEDGSVTYTPQNHEAATKTRLITKDMGHLDFDQTAEEIERFVRGMSPWPSAHTRLSGKTLKVWKCKVADAQEDERCKEHAAADCATGEVVLVDKQHIFVKTGEGFLRLDEIQLEGKRRMSCEEFLRGYRVEERTSF
ncbi:MAG: methionyl-tRNA formyltransferase [Lachnospiraceae bacterium]|jgi:methionyl-tRNA formyltransferase|nr:methionyl-tRNA formyltransferase [Lachnospiraceae bacterium]